MNLYAPMAARSVHNDLHLKCTRGTSSWEVLESPARYFIPVRTQQGKQRTIHLQGTCFDGSGKEYSMEGLAELVDRYRLEALDFLDGSFVLAVDDRRDGPWCATDHSATLPLYWKFGQDAIIVTTRPENIRIT